MPFLSHFPIFIFLLLHLLSWPRSSLPPQLQTRGDIHHPSIHSPEGRYLLVLPILQLYGKLGLLSLYLSSVCLIKIHSWHVRSYFLSLNSKQVPIFLRVRVALCINNSTFCCVLHYVPFQNRWYPVEILKSCVTIHDFRSLESPLWISWDSPAKCVVLCFGLNRLVWVCRELKQHPEELCLNFHKKCFIVFHYVS